MRARLGAVTPAAAGAAALGFVTVLALGSVDGGFFRDSWPWTTIGLAAAAAMGVVLRTQLELSRAAVGVVAGFAAVASWTRVTGVWAENDAAVVPEAERALVYVAGSLAAALVVTRATAPAVLVGVLGATVVLAVYSLAAGPYVIGSLEGPIGYANALGILAAIGLLLAAALAVLTRPRWARAVLAVCAVPLAWALVETGSRGAAVALAAGAGVAIVLAPRGRLLLLAAAAVALVAAALVARVPAPSALLAGDRPEYWRVAARQFSEHPVVGAGAGAFHAYWLEHRPDPGTLDTPDVLDAHSLYLETLAELGLVGLALVLVPLAIPLGVGVRFRDDRVVAAALPAYVAFVVHAGLDWDWEMPAVTLAGVFCGVAILAAGVPRPVRPWARPIALVLAFALIVDGFRRTV